MKKLFTLFTFIFSLFTSEALAQTVLHESEWTCPDNWEWSETGYVQIMKSDLGDLAAGDKLQITVTKVSATDQWPAVYLQYSDVSWTWTDFDKSSEPYQVMLNTEMEMPYTAEFEMPASMVEKIMDGNSLIIKGSGYTANKVTLVKAQTLPAGVIWQGEKVMPASWGAWVTLGADKFQNCKAGDVLRLMTKNVGAGAQAQLSSSSWARLDGKSFGGRYCDFTITQNLLTELQANGCIINGCDYTLTEVKYFDPSTVASYSPALNITQPDWTWTDSKPVIGIKLTNPNAAEAKVTVEVALTTDKGEAVKTYTQEITLAANEAGKVVNFTLEDIENPGIYRFTAYVNDEAVSYTRPEDQAYTWTTLNIAYQPEKISSPADAQSDFADFWAAAKTQLKGIEMNAQLELVQEGTYRNLYRVTLNSIPNGLTGDPVQIRGYYAEVKAEGKFPCVINYMGYDSGGTGDLWYPKADDRQDYNELIISARGQSFGNREPYKADNIYCNTSGADQKDFNIKDGWWFTYHFGDKDSYYYRGAYMDQVRGIDFVCSRDKVDTQNIFATGGSQGGAFTLIAAALSDGRLRAIAPSIQFMGDFPDYFQVGNWPVSEAKAAAAMQSMSEEEMYKFLSYFDTKNFASMITAPTMSSIGLQDNVCPAHTNLAPFNLLTCEKQLYVNKNLVHEVPNNNTWSTPNNSERDWTALCNAWWQSHMLSTGVEAVSGSKFRVSGFSTSSQQASQSKVFNLAGQRVGTEVMGIVIENGQKVLK